MSSASRSTDGRPLSALLGLTPEQLCQRQAFFQLEGEDLATLAALAPFATEQVEGIVAQFYDHLLAFPPLRALLEAKPDRIDKLKSLQREYFLGLTRGAIDEAYVESRLRVGNAHQAVGLKPQWYVGAFGLYLRLALRSVITAAGEGERMLPTIEALVKVIFFDMALAMDTYIYGGFVDRDAAASLQLAAEVAERALREREEVEQLKTDLTSMVVHDLKNPVNGIAMLVQLALRKGADLPEGHRNYLLSIDRTCREMMRLVQNLLEIAKLEEGKMPIPSGAVVLAELADEVAREYRPVAELASRILRIEVDTSLPSALGDRGLLRRVLANLIVNALRHSGSDEVRVEGAAGPGEGEVTLNVIDRGMGIPDGDQHRVFEKYRTIRRSPADAPTTDTGLGLPFCKLAIEHMGGHISVESVPGTRTVFSVTLPVA